MLLREQGGCCHLNKMSMIYEALLELHAEMVLDDAIREFEERRLYEAIDEALMRKDERSFIALTTKLKSLQTLKQNKRPG